MMSILSRASRLHRPYLTIAALLLVAVAMGCLPFGRGTYQVDLFSEMHYTQAYRSQEPPRLYPAQGSVPFTPVGAGALTVEDLTVERTADTVAQGMALYGVNCVVCHGAAGKGDGAIVNYLIKWNAVLPTDLTATTTVERTDETLLGLISEGGPTNLVLTQAGQDPANVPGLTISMPVFRKLLTEEERWALVHYVRSLQGQ